MELLDSSGACFALDDDLLNFKLDGEGEEEEGHAISDGASASSPVKTSNSAAAPAPFCCGAFNAPFPEFVEEEELEWLSNKDAFPALDTCFGILADNPELVMNHQSPVSVLENSNSNSSSISSHSNGNSNSNSNAISFQSVCNSLKVPNHPVRARSKRRRRRAGFGNLPSQQSLWLNQVNVKIRKEELPPLTTAVAGMGRRCLHCQAEKTPQWRAGPMGPKTLCNACGVRYKSGRLLPEYRPASSPTFSNELHSNSHRKVVEMRRQKEYIGGEGIPVNVACGYRVG